jgi:DNA mismatch repair protein MutS
MRQWRRVKDQHPGKIVLFRMGDFYEMFGEDARTAAEVLEIALTTREKNKAEPMPMAGIPHHALEAYLGRLIRAGFKVVLCDQVEDPATAKGLVRREVTRVVTPGTALEEGVVEASQPVLLAAWCPGVESAGLAWADLSSGDLVVWLSTAAEAEDRLRAVGPAEILHPEGAPPPEVPGATVTPLPAAAFSPRDPRESLCRRFGLPAGLPGLPPDREALGALHAILDYLQDRGANILKSPRTEVPGTFLVLDEATRRNLELVGSTESGGRKGTLLEALDATLTPMGARLLRDWLLAPSAEREEILRRQGTLACWLTAPQNLRAARDRLRGYPDLARITARLGAGIATPRDAGMLREALRRLPGVRECLAASGGIPEALGREELDRWADHLASVLEECPPPHAREGGIFARGWNPELDALRELAENAHAAILEVERKERERTGISSLKVRYNKIFGYFLEVSRSNLARVPPDFERRQTLVNGERFVTPELRDLEARILSARADREALESKLWEGLLADLVPHLPAFQEAAGALGREDVLAGFAHIARERAYTRPEVVEDPVLVLEESRHPVLELDARHQPFVPNPVHLDTQEDQVVLLTGPNMGGKSTYLRQAALIAIMAQAGSFVPARRAVTGLVDRLFCRVGAGDSLLRGLSTFMMEMTETAAILRNATRRSLVILDEVGRGTSTYDGLAIAWAVVEALRGGEGGVGCRTLFATHYHELTELGRTLAGVRNLTMGVREHEGRVIFLRTVEEGAADRSYGIHVAELAGVPEEVVERARAVLARLEARRAALTLESPVPGRPHQPDLFSGEGGAQDARVLAELRAADERSLSPLEALLLIHRLRKKLGMHS